MSFPSSCSLERYTSVAGEGQGVGGRIVSALDDDGRMGPGREKRLERDGCYSREGVVRPGTGEGKLGNRKGDR